MRIHLNGKELETSSTTLSQLIAENGLETRSLIAELNLSIIKEQDWPTTRLSDDDRIELLNFVGGG